ncbi:serine/threonine-protein phosphatase 2A activator 1 [Myxozyma melibiosi]|uniref:Serine/threonine-protein phosphatase 2A activator n=1 Tax=Myxozyma melibiosi TaxID=54550 RepID=A0ABR1F7C5_9ASCO
MTEPIDLASYRKAVFPHLPPDARFSAPEKRIHISEDLRFFHSTTAYARIQFLLNYVSELVSKVDAPGSADGLLPGVQSVAAVLDRLAGVVDEVPPVSGPRRFGNPAYKTWYHRAETEILTMVGEIIEARSVTLDAKDELAAYLIAALGSVQRLDFGTGHELSFLAFFGGCLFLGLLDDEKSGTSVSGEDILWIFSRYFKMVRKVITTYSLEPAGSHGVWGLDDHFHLPYILGSAQLRGVEEKFEGENAAAKPKVSSRPSRPSKAPSMMSVYGMPRPSAVMSMEIINDFKEKNMYFGAIAFIYQVKKGPFFEHSPVLYDISGVQYWVKVHSGLLKMYNAEVLGKFPVVQHFGFGGVLYPWAEFAAAGAAAAGGTGDKSR